MGNKTSKQILLWGTIAAVVLGILQYAVEVTANPIFALNISSSMWMMILASVGLVAGILAVRNKGLETNTLIAIIGLTVASGSASIVPIAGMLVTSIAKNVLSFILPVVLVTGLGKLAIK